MTLADVIPYAHSLDNRPQSAWEPLGVHLREVAELAASFAKPFGWAAIADLAARLHDVGKSSDAFQAYIRGEGHSVDHSTAGARIAAEHYPGFAGRMVALLVAGHHAGLADASDLERRLDAARTSIPEPIDWMRHAGELPGIAGLKPTLRFRQPAHAKVLTGFTHAFLIRMLFSCLVDADFLCTERFISRGEERPVDRGVDVSVTHLRERLAAHMERLQRDAADTPLNALRADIRKHAVGKAALEPGLFTLTVPTGGGKTLASLDFALEHALRHGKRRVIYVIPYTSIIEQTAEVFRTATGEPDAILEHHASFDWERAARQRDGGDEQDGLGRLRRAAENWDAPIVVTTAVQFFESLFANRTSQCRKLHNLTDSVVVLDEAQTLPTPLLLPCLAALDELARNYGASVVLCTATQPAIREQDGTLVDNGGRNLGLHIPDDRELAPDPPSLYRDLKRVAVEVLPEPVGDERIAARFADSPQMLCIVNSRAHARKLFDALEGQEGRRHLTTLMCPAHRREVLADARARLKAGLPVRLVATSLIEAGVDVDFPEVWRAEAGLDSIAQAAGRANREGRLGREGGRVVVFTPAEGKAPRALEAFQQAARPVLREHAEDPLSLEAVSAYFRQLYFHKGLEALDTAEVAGRPGVLAALCETAADWRFPFKSLAEAFRLIDDVMEPVVVPWDEEARAVLDRLRRTDKPLTHDLRKLQSYTVGIPKKAYGEWLAKGVLVPVRADMGEALLRFEDLAHYRPDTGVDLLVTTYRDPLQNQF